MHGYPAKYLCQIFFVFLCTILLLPHVHATAVKHIHTPSKAEVNSDIKKTPQVKSLIASDQTVASPKLILTTNISNLQLAHATYATKTRSLNTLADNSLSNRTSPNISPYVRSANSGLTTKNTDIQNQIQASLVEEEFENENKLLLGLTLIFITGLVIIYLFSKYKLLLWQRNLSLRKLFKWRQLGQRAQIQII